MKRSLSILLVLGLLAAIPVAALAEPILAAIIPADLPRYKEAHKAMAQILEAGGFGAPGDLVDQGEASCRQAEGFAVGVEGEGEVGGAAGETPIIWT